MVRPLCLLPTGSLVCKTFRNPGAYWDIIGTATDSVRASPVLPQTSLGIPGSHMAFSRHVSVGAFTWDGFLIFAGFS